MRDGGVTDADKRCDVADAQFAARERVEDPNPRGIAKNPEGIGQGLDRSRVQERRVALSEFAWEQISEPGTYVEKETGDLYRIPKEAFVLGGSLMILKTSLGTSRFVQLSKNPFITTLEARMQCAAYNIQANF